ncbi:DUF4234 domain-containing protein [Salicibibacter kimchii]|uniref:DUF4234 domain-containing protein n=1 Tax=Salicibibacter kimchii TaxID=2099786 RepID=A0A345BZ40_9BACI|nr:DUF4234 domain-containing protein [Salicibibacter kimchii]AXF56221.1 hypothetical protein DT065_09470 [Salicibibacter kimchii]
MEATLPQKMNRPKKSQVWLTVALTILTVGMYSPYWFLTRRKALNQFDEFRFIPMGLPFLVLISFGALTVVLLLSIWVYILTPYFLIYNAFESWISWFGFISLIYLSLVTRYIFKKNVEGKEPNIILTILFMHVYLQYYINRAYHRRGETDAEAL